MLFAMGRWKIPQRPVRTEVYYMYQVPFIELEEKSINELQDAMAAGTPTSRQLVEIYQERIQALDQDGPALKSVLDINPAGLPMAAAFDEELRTQRPPECLH